MDTYDAIVIGAGQSGPPLAARLADAGQRVAMIERGDFGGTCVNNGCTPTKAMVASARAAWVARQAAEYGVMVSGDVRVDMARVKARKDRMVEKSRSGVERWMQSLQNGTVFRGHARFVDAHTVRVNDDILSAERIFLDVGGRPLVPKMTGVDRVPFLTNETIMDVDYLPEHLMVVGGSYVGLEFGQMYRRFGSRVTVVEMGPRLIGREDPDVSAAVTEILSAEGIDVRTDAKCIALDRGADGVMVKLECVAGAPTIAGSHILLAVGRAPNTDDLGLREAGIETDDRGYVKVDDALRTTAPNVYALGDCNGRGAFTHTSYNDYEIVADNLLNGTDRKVTDRVTIYALFTDPPLGRVGMSEAEAREGEFDVRVGKRPMTRVARAVEKGETRGFMKVVVDERSRRILGAAFLGTDGDEVVHSLVDAIYAKLPYTDVQRTVRLHPTVSELVPTVLGELEPPR
jgi:pyruvate/2-oxoglutarate dehydrogenase complex dihydrolipoamide dehydrogenase (E3) component